MKTTKLGAVLAMTTLAGCAASTESPAPPGPERADETTATTEAPLTVSMNDEFTPFGYTGGPGGHGPYWLGCNNGNQVVAGFFGHSGSTTDQLGVVCANLNSDGSINSYVWPQVWYGGDGGNYFQQVCPANQFVTAVQMNWEPGGTVNGLFMYCQTAGEAFGGGTLTGKNDTLVIVVQNFAEYETVDNCNALGWNGAVNPRSPAAVKGFYLRAATYIDALEPVCITL